MQKPEPFVNGDTVFSVTDASALLKGVVETAFPRIKIRGELSQITRATSGRGNICDYMAWDTCFF